MLSEGHRADMLLDLAGLERNERTMIQASIGNARDFDRIADALIVQHPRIHLKGTLKQAAKPKGGKTTGKGNSGSRKGKGKGKGNGFRRNPSGFAFHAAEDTACGYTAAEDDYIADPAYVDDEDYSDGDAEAYNA